MRTPKKGFSLGDCVSLSEWDYNKNIVSPFEIPAGSLFKSWWICSKCSHSWQTAARNRKDGTGCPKCTRTKNQTLDITHPYLIQEWNYKKNKLPPKKYTKGSTKKVWWVCSLGHEWEAVIGSRTNSNSDCPICCNQKVLAGYNDLESKFPDISKEWNYKKNKFSPSEIVFGSTKKVWWVCSLGYEWQASVLNRTKMKRGCHYCSNRKVLAGYNDFKTKYPELVKEYSNRNSVLPEQILYGSNNKFWWVCEEGHEWETTIPHRAISRSGCPYCSGNKVITGETDLATTHPHLVKEWSPKNTLSPTEVAAGSHKKMWWICEEGHEWKTAIENRKEGHGCPSCVRSPAEKELGEFLASITNERILCNDRKLIAPYELDIVIPELQLAIEYNGEYWHSEALLQKRFEMSAKEYHEMKVNRCREKGIKLLFVWENDWKSRNHEVKNALQKYFDNKIPNTIFNRLQ